MDTAAQVSRAGGASLTRAVNCGGRNCAHASHTRAPAANTVSPSVLTREPRTRVRPLFGQNDCGY